MDSKTSIDVKRMTEEELNTHVLDLTIEHQFGTAAELIAQWVYWDEVKKEVLEVVEWEREQETTSYDKYRGDMGEEMSNRMMEEFGPEWGPEIV